MVLGLMTQALRLKIHGSDSSWGQLKLNCVFKGILEDMITENMVEFLIYRPVLRPNKAKPTSSKAEQCLSLLVLKPNKA